MDISTIITIISIIVTTVSLTYPIRDSIKQWQLRHLRKIFGIKNGEKVLVVCSELTNPKKRQMIEEREFIYLMKYGDIDAWVEYLLSMMKIFPKVSFETSSSGESLNNKLFLEEHIAIIGGPDYNKLAKHFIDKGITRFIYKEIGEEIVIHDKKTKKDYYYTTLDKDFGYIEKIPNPYNRSKYIFLFGGCHTIGVTSAVKFFSAFSNGKSSVSNVALDNAKRIVKADEIDINNFALLINATKIGATISYPCLHDLIDIDAS
jgi:hypothetical protein